LTKLKTKPRRFKVNPALLTLGAAVIGIFSFGPQ